MIGHPHNFLIPTILVLATILIVSGMRLAVRTRQVRLHRMGDDALRLLAEKAVAAQSATAEVLASTKAELLDVRTRLVSIERMLQEVG